MAGSLKGIDAYRHLPLGDVGSTNTECLDRARKGEPGGLWITADRQLTGRGRRGRSWVSEPGNLYASLLLIDPAEPARLASLPLAVAVAVHEAVRQSLPPDARDRVRVKWPNDVLIGGAKTSGILIESEILPDKRRAVVIGCGVNVGHHPGEGIYPTTCLVEEGASVSPQELFAHLFVAMADSIAAWDGGAGIAATRADWLARAGGIGSEVTVRLPDREIRGLFESVDGEGRMVLLDNAGRRQTIAAGDVFYPSLAPAAALAGR